MIAAMLGATIAESMHRVTHREFLVWCAHFEEEWNRPSRGDHYLASIVAEIRRWKVKDPRSIALADCLLKFDVAGERKQATTESVELASRMSQAAWFARVGGNVKGVPENLRGLLPREGR